MKSQPFKRLKSMIMLAHHLIDASGGIMSMEKALKLQTPYYSRGKGRKNTQRANKHSHMSAVRASRKKKNANRK